MYSGSLRAMTPALSVMKRWLETVVRIIIGTGQPLPFSTT
jgi:hypothetical protein